MARRSSTGRRCLLRREVRRAGAHHPRRGSTASSCAAAPTAAPRARSAASSSPRSAPSARACGASRRSPVTPPTRSWSSASRPSTGRPTRPARRRPTRCRPRVDELQAQRPGPGEAPAVRRARAVAAAGRAHPRGRGARRWRGSSRGPCLPSAMEELKAYARTSAALPGGRHRARAGRPGAAAVRHRQRRPRRPGGRRGRPRPRCRAADRRQGWRSSRDGPGPGARPGRPAARPSRGSGRGRRPARPAAADRWPSCAASGDASDGQAGPAACTALDIGTEYVKALVFEIARTARAPSRGVGRTAPGPGPHAVGHRDGHRRRVVDNCRSALAGGRGDGRHPTRPRSSSASPASWSRASRRATARSASGPTRRSPTRSSSGSSRGSSARRCARRSAPSPGRPACPTSTSASSMPRSPAPRSTATRSPTRSASRVATCASASSTRSRRSSTWARSRAVAEQLGLELLAVVAEPYAVARCIAGEQVAQAGALFIDVGGGTTDVALVRQGGVEGTRMFALGGRAFTKSLADRLDLPFAERRGDQDRPRPRPAGRGRRDGRGHHGRGRRGLVGRRRAGARGVRQAGPAARRASSCAAAARGWSTSSPRCATRASRAGLPFVAPARGLDHRAVRGRRSIRDRPKLAGRPAGRDPAWRWPTRPSS